MAKSTERKRTVTLYSPTGAKVTVAADREKHYTARRYSKTAPKSKGPEVAEVVPFDEDAARAEIEAQVRAELEAEAAEKAKAEAADDKSPKK